MVLIIIVEGPDGAGKTTLIRELSARYNIPIAPRVVSKEAEGLGGNGKAWVEENLAQGFQYTLFDRHRLISEFIYGPVLRTEQEPGFTDMWWVYKSLQRFYSLGPLVIYCLPPLELVRANVLHDDDNSAVAKFIEPIYSSYLHRFAMDTFAGFNPLVWDYNSDGKELDPLRTFDSAFASIQKRVGL